MLADRMLFFLLGTAVAILVFWLWELMTRGGHREFVRRLDNRVASEKVAEILEEIRRGQLGELEREEIWWRMTWVWKEARLMAVASNRLLALPFLALFLLVYVLVWFKVLVVPRSGDLRFLIAVETVLMSLVNEENPAK